MTLKNLILSRLVRRWVNLLYDQLFVTDSKETHNSKLDNIKIIKRTGGVSTTSTELMVEVQPTRVIRVTKDPGPERDTICLRI